MRLFPIISALFICAAMYFFIFERDKLINLGRVNEGNAATAAFEEKPALPEPTGEATEAPDGAIGVVAMRSSAKTLNNAVIVRGQTEADRQVELRAETSGQVVSDPLKKGTFINTGQILCELDPGTRNATLKEAEARLVSARLRIPEAEAQVPEAEARVAEAQARVVEAKAKLAEAEINLNAAIRLYEDGYASEARVAQTTAQMEGVRAQIVSAEAGLKAALSGMESVAAGIESAKVGVKSALAAKAVAEKEIERLKIKAPFEGLLESDTAEMGSLLQPGGLCATIIRLDPIILVGFIPETAVEKVKIGAMAGARLASGKEVMGKVIFLSRSADSKTRTFRVEIEVPNSDLAIRDGQTAEIAISSEGALAHLLPQSALTLSDSGKIGVRIVTEDGLAEFVAVTVLRDSVDGIWLAGLPKHVDIIVIGQEFVTDGVRVAASYQDVTQ
ncbi:MAG: efflux RND transporter periplasmic adaptor subunit [Roseovarius sp.]|nr:efflux RND transporter periplasmic adaptor subunit [Roseovarius sp.]